MIYATQYDIGYHWNKVDLSSTVFCVIHPRAISQEVLMNSKLQWRYNGHDGVSNHQPHHCLLNRLVRRRSNKTPKFRVTGHCAGNSPVTGEFPPRMASNTENVSIWWRHHDQWNVHRNYTFRINTTSPGSRELKTMLSYFLLTDQKIFRHKELLE